MYFIDYLSTKKKNFVYLDKSLKRRKMWFSMNLGHYFNKILMGPPFKFCEVESIDFSL